MSSPYFGFSFLSDSYGNKISPLYIPTFRIITLMRMNLALFSLSYHSVLFMYIFLSSSPLLFPQVYCTRAMVRTFSFPSSPLSSAASWVSTDKNNTDLRELLRTAYCFIVNNLVWLSPVINMWDPQDPHVSVLLIKTYIGNTFQTHQV